MSSPKPIFPKNDVNRAGEIISSDRHDVRDDELAWALNVLSNWRASHGYPISTFRVSLHERVRHIDPLAFVAKRLKRAPSVILKLRRFPTMKLVQMQDIGGLRVVANNTDGIRALNKLYRGASIHKLHSSKDYVDAPKSDGYRGIHLVFRYGNPTTKDYDGLFLELQLRTRRQHAWATAVETMGTFLGQSLKIGQGETSWKEFFAVTSAAFAHLENTRPVPGYEGFRRDEVYEKVASLERELGVCDRLSGFAVATDRIMKEAGLGHYYHLVVLDTARKSVSIKPFTQDQLEQASSEYARVEERTRNGEKVEAVLVSAGRVQELREAYPNYFLDTGQFLRQIDVIVGHAMKR